MMFELLVRLVIGAISTALLTVVLGLLTTWALLTCVLVAALVSFLGIVVISFAGDGDGDFL